MCENEQAQQALQGFTKLRGTFPVVIASNVLMARCLDLSGAVMRILRDAPPRILIADDQPDLIDALRLLLKGEGIEYEAVTSPEAALRALRSCAFDLWSRIWRLTRSQPGGDARAPVASARAWRLIGERPSLVHRFNARTG